jgi:hypothetical protein
MLSALRSLPRVRVALLGLLGVAVVATPGAAAALRSVTLDPLLSPRATAEIDWSKMTNTGEVDPFVLITPDPKERLAAVDCLADAIYYEAAFEPVAGQRAVAQVVVNRVRDRNFPKSVCGVVFQGAERKTGCQFTFTCDGSMNRRPPKPKQRARAKVIAEQALSGYVATEVGTATHYHTDWVDPYWKPTLDEITQVGDHVFYKWRGKAGKPTALKNARYEGDEIDVWAEYAKRPVGRVLG